MKKGTFVLIVLLRLVTLPVYGQNQSERIEDSLRQELKKNMADTSRVKVLTKLGRRLMEQGRYDESANALKEAEKYAVKSGNKAAVRSVMHTEGTLNFYKGDYLTAERIWTKGKELAEQEHDTSGADQFSGLLANVFLMQNNYLRALDIYLKLLKKAEASENEESKAIYNGNIGTLYVNMNEPGKALPYLETCKKLAEKTNNYGMLGNLMITLSVTYKKLKDYKHAEFAAKELMRYATLLKSDALLQTSYILKTELYVAQDRFMDGLDVINEFFVNYPKDVSRSDLFTAYGQKAMIYDTLISLNNQEFLQKYFKGNKSAALKEALSLIDSAIALTIESGQVASLNDFYKTRSSIRRQLGDFKGALEDYMQFKVLSDSVYNTEKNNEMTQKTLGYEFEKKEAAMREEQIRKDIRARNIRNSIAAGLGLSLIFGFVVYGQRNKIAKEKKRSEELLLNILPADVADELKVKGSAEAKMMDEVTVLFTDFKGFTALAEHLTPKQLVADINECFSAFDLIMQSHGIEKIKTIGDSYMAAGGLPVANTTHANDVVNAALEIQQYMSDYIAKKKAAGEPFFEIRIGIHSGPVVAGIVGIKKFSYDIWGDTVNTASRIESSGEAGKVNISESTFALVKDKFRCSPRGKIQAKGKGEIEMYFVEERV